MIIMKKTIMAAVLAAVLLSISLVSPSCGMRGNAKAQDTLRINTTNLGKDIIGFNGPTPVEITVVKGIISQIKALPNRESPRYQQYVEDSGLLKALDGKTIEEAKAVELDAVSGATYTSTALIKNIRLGLENTETK